VDLQARWDAPWDARLSAGVRNLFDQDPPVLSAGSENNFDPAYEIPGRFLYVSYAQRF
jgi:iron complex outermembrane receptor protein